MKAARSRAARFAFVAVLLFLAPGAWALTATPTRGPSPAPTGELGARTLTGQVRDPDGNPLAGVGVSYRHTSPVPGRGSSGAVTTDLDGFYRITLFLHDSDTVTISVRVTGYRTASITASGTQVFFGQVNLNFRLVPNCPADCDGDTQVSVAELVTAVNIALGERALSACLPADADFDATVTVSDLVSAVRAALSGCPTMVQPTPSPTPLGACRTGEDCDGGGGQYCRLADDPNVCGICLDQEDECDSDADCAGLGELGICIEAGIHSCPACSPPLFICEIGCVSDLECRPWERCGADHHCGPVPCDAKEDCPAEFDCAGTQCERRACARDDDCDAGPCLRGACYAELGTCELLPP